MKEGIIMAELGTKKVGLDRDSLEIKNDIDGIKLNNELKKIKKEEELYFAEEAKQKVVAKKKQVIKKQQKTRRAIAILIAAVIGFAAIKFGLPAAKEKIEEINDKAIMTDILVDYNNNEGYYQEAPGVHLTFDELNNEKKIEVISRPEEITEEEALDFLQNKDIIDDDYQTNGRGK